MAVFFFFAFIISLMLIARLTHHIRVARLTITMRLFRHAFTALIAVNMINIR